MDRLRLLLLFSSLLVLVLFPLRLLLLLLAGYSRIPQDFPGKLWVHYNRTFEKKSKHPHSQPVEQLSY